MIVLHNTKQFGKHYTLPPAGPQLKGDYSCSKINVIVANL